MFDLLLEDLTCFTGLFSSVDPRFYLSEPLMSTLLNRSLCVMLDLSCGEPKHPETL